MVGSDVTSSSPPIGDFGLAPKFAASDPELLSQAPVPGDATLYGQYPSRSGSSNETGGYGPFSAGGLDGVSVVSDGVNERASRPSHPPNSSDLLGHSGLQSSATYVDGYMELRSWPPNLPTPDVTRHL